MGSRQDVNEWKVEMSIIYGERVRLSAVERENLKKYHEWLNDPEVTRGLDLYLQIGRAHV